MWVCWHSWRCKDNLHIRYLKWVVQLQMHMKPRSRSEFLYLPYLAISVVHDGRPTGLRLWRSHLHRVAAAPHLYPPQSSMDEHVLPPNSVSGRRTRKTSQDIDGFDGLHCLVLFSLCTIQIRNCARSAPLSASPTPFQAPPQPACMVPSSSSHRPGNLDIKKQSYFFGKI